MVIKYNQEVTDKVIEFSKGGDVMFGNSNDRLVGYRKMLKINQCELASLLGISATSYSKKETGKIEFTQSEMIKITQCIKSLVPNVTMDDIFFKRTVSKMVTADTA